MIVITNRFIHNIESSIDRSKALGKVKRVLRADAIVVLIDITNQDEYVVQLQALGFQQIERKNDALRDAVLKAITFGSFALLATITRKVI